MPFSFHQPDLVSHPSTLDINRRWVETRSQTTERDIVPQSFTNLLYHLIFSTKNRRPWITELYRPRLYDYIGGIVHAADGIPLGINGTEDHVHVLAKLGPTQALADVLRDLKSNATGWLHDIFPELHEFSWQRGYAAFTVSHSHVKKVRNYIAHQQEHHRKISFREEFERFLIANDIKYDPRYLL